MTVVYKQCEPKNVHQMMPASYMGVLAQTNEGIRCRDLGFRVLGFRDSGFRDRVLGYRVTAPIL